MSAIIVNKEKKKEEIVLAALHVYATKGFARTTVKDIAEQAGIGKGTIYEYFKDKEEIVHSSFFYFQRFFEFDIQEVLLSEIDGKSKLVKLIRSILMIVNDDNNKYLDLMFDFWAEGIKGHEKSIMLKEMNKFYKSYRSLFEDVLKEGKDDGSISSDLDPFSFSSIIVGMMDGLMVQWILDKKNIDLVKIEKNLIDLILIGTENRKLNKEAKE